MNYFTFNRTRRPDMPALIRSNGWPRPAAAQRRHNRARFAASVRLRLSTGCVVEARTLDISLGGVQLLLPINLPVDAVCQLQLSVPAQFCGTRTVVAEAKVASALFSGRENGFLAGLRFTRLPAASQAGLEDYLRQRAPQPHGSRRRSR
jgi:hypothetical protein